MIPPKLATGDAATPYRAGFPPTITSDLARPLLTLTEQLRKYGYKTLATFSKRRRFYVPIWRMWILEKSA